MRSDLSIVGKCSGRSSRPNNVVFGIQENVLELLRWSDAVKVEPGSTRGLGHDAKGIWGGGGQTIDSAETRYRYAGGSALYRLKRHLSTVQ